jgi:MFS transporter, AAHS family, vanillate permease
VAPRSPGTIIAQGAMSGRQWAAVLVLAALNALDGFDVLSISFASPGISHDWGIDKATLGWVLSAELLGMALGSVLLGTVADKKGRRPMILGCLVGMAIGMYAAAQSPNVPILLLSRLVTGLGIGGLLAAINAATAEVSNNRWRSLAMALMVIGYPLGGVLGGVIVRHLLAIGTWRDVFMAGAVATALFIPIVWWLVPESAAFLERSRSPDALARINRILIRFGHAAVDALTAPVERGVERSGMELFRPALAATTIVMTFAYFAHMTSFYFILKWVPKIIVDLGFAQTAAAGVLMWVNVGGATGGVIFGLLATRVGLKRLTIATLIGSSAMIIAFGYSATDIVSLTTRVAVAGSFANATLVGLYSLLATVFPTHVRASGTGFAVGVGRGGAVLAPVLAGYLFQAGCSLQTVATIMAIGSLAAAVALLSHTQPADLDLSYSPSPGL